MVEAGNIADPVRTPCKVIRYVACHMTPWRVSPRLSVGSRERFCPSIVSERYITCRIGVPGQSTQSGPSSSVITNRPNRHRRHGCDASNSRPDAGSAPHGANKTRVSVTKPRSLMGQAEDPAGGRPEPCRLTQFATNTQCRGGYGARARCLSETATQWPHAGTESSHHLEFLC